MSFTKTKEKVSDFKIENNMEPCLLDKKPNIELF